MPDKTITNKHWPCPHSLNVLGPTTQMFKTINATLHFKFTFSVSLFQIQTIRLGLENFWFSQKEGFKLCRLVGLVTFQIVIW